VVDPAEAKRGVRLAHGGRFGGLYTRPYDDERFPQVCLDEKSKQLVGEVREPLTPGPGRPARRDYEHKRGGTANLFMISEPLAGWRHT